MTDSFALDERTPLALCQYLVDKNYYDLYVCYASFVAQEPSDLSINEGDIIVAINQVNEHWIQGQVCFDSQSNRWPNMADSSSQQVGTFPLNHCWQMNSKQVEAFCYDKLKEYRQQQQQEKQHEFIISQQQTLPNQTMPFRQPFLTAIHSSSLSSGSSSLHSSDSQQQTNGQQLSQPPPRPLQLPRQIVTATSEDPIQRGSSILTSRQSDKLKGWLHTVRKKTARLSTRITASLGLISLTRDEEFERHYSTFRHIEKTIRVFIKNLTTFVEHFEHFLLALQNTSENLADFYRDKSHHRELEALKKKNKALACEHFHAFKRTVERQVVAVSSQLLQKFSGPQQLVVKRSAKLLDYDTKTKEMESCRDLDKKAALRNQYVIAKDLYDRINRQLIEELPMFNQFAIDIFKDCILVLLESRKNLIRSYTQQTASLLDTPLMMTYTASDVASSILMSCQLVQNFPQVKQSTEINEIMEQSRKDSGQTSGHGTRHNSANDEDPSRPHSVASQLSSEFDQMALKAREISSTPLSQVGEVQPEAMVVKFPDEPDGGLDNVHRDISEKVESKIEVVGSPGSTQPMKRFEPQRDKRKKKKLQIYIASWPFVATGPNQLTIVCKQPLKLIKGCDECGNSDWSLVQDKKGQLGYVPSSYIKKKE